MEHFASMVEAFLKTVSSDKTIISASLTWSTFNHNDSFPVLPIIDIKRQKEYFDNDDLSA